MSTRNVRSLTITCIVGALAVTFSLTFPGGRSSASQAGSQFPCLLPVQPTLTSQVPGDSPINDQNSLNCFAWQEFIALNWPAATSADGKPASVGAPAFGRPGELQPVVWETFMDIHQLMTPDGDKPQLWGTPPAVPPACQRLGDDGARPLVRTSKISIEFDVPEDLAEAFPTNAPDWLADRRGNPVLYEILVNEAEYDYVVKNGFYNAETQYSRASAGVHVDLPRGTTAGTTGAIEIKAAWLTLDEPVDQRWKARYKLARAYAYDKKNNSCRLVTVALVGLHILHKTTSNPQWVWSTFEHVDNAPDQSAVDRGKIEKHYNFYDSDCKVRDVPAQCQSLRTSDCEPPSTAITRTSCTPNTPPAYCLDLDNPECPAYPTQVTRLTPIPDSGDNLVEQLNQAVHQLIREQAGKDSIWQHYQLVGVLWSGSPVDENLPGTPPPLTPLSIAGMRPDPVAIPVANTTLETYVQRTTCIGCHRGASLAWSSQDPQRKQFASDYSFIFQSAGPHPPEEGEQ